MAPLKQKGDLAELMVAADLGNGRAALSLRMRPTRNGQRSRIRWCEDHVDI